MAMLESEFSLFEVQSEGLLWKDMKLSQPMLGIAPKRFNHVDMLGVSYKFIVAVINPEIPINANINKSIVATTTIAVKITLLVSTLQRIMSCSVASEVSGTISV